MINQKNKRNLIRNKYLYKRRISKGINASRESGTPKILRLLEPVYSKCKKGMDENTIIK